MTAADFSAWVAHMRTTRGWSQAECQRQLGIGQNMVTRWMRVSKPSAWLGLACAALAADLPAWTASDRSPADHTPSHPAPPS